VAADSVPKANAAYDRWLRREIRGKVVAADLRKKREKMASGPFPFLRATYWRWAETILDICPDLADAPTTVAVGDIHLENFGVWLDDDGRLIWGVNDFDEAAVMPYALDLVRLATSAALARPSRVYRGGAICAAILDGYSRGLKDPRPFVLDREHTWLHELLVASEDEHARFWNKMTKLKGSKNLPGRYRRAIEAALPDGAEIVKFSRRTAGTGSLGRPRWVGIADWHGGLVVREAKALVPSGWTRAHGRRGGRLRVQDIADGRYRAPDPWFSANNKVVVRRLSPNNRKIEVEAQSDQLLSQSMLRAMGHELANIHLGTADRRNAIARDFRRRSRGWLHRATRAAAAAVSKEFKEWRKQHGKRAAK
jgi:uncharacterized protein (DUF2252 family)